MRQMDVIESLEKIAKSLNADTDRYTKLADSEAKQNNLDNAAYWRGKGMATIHAVTLIEDLIEAYNDEKEQELEDMAAERSEKDCMWEAD